MEEKIFADQVVEGERFEFGKNWEAYLTTLTEEKIEIAMQSLIEMLGCTSLSGKKFLDVGCGSGLFSLAAMRLGALVFSFDFDPNSVKCTQILKQKYFRHSNWVIEEGSILNEQYIRSLGQFDIVYSWGVLHHTGNLYKALEHVAIPVKEKGSLFIAIYNDQGKISDRWRRVKKIYNSGSMGRSAIVLFYFTYYFSRNLISDLIRFKNPGRRYADYKKIRGMSMIHDWYDWLGGWPFEVASPEAIFEYYKEKDFTLTKLKTSLGLACNQFVFRKDPMLLSQC